MTIKILAVGCAALVAAACAKTKSDDEVDGGPAGADASPGSGPGPIFPDAAPQTRCGDGTISTSAGEVCDDGNESGGDGCAADCKAVECDFGDSYVSPVTNRCFWRSQDVGSRNEAVLACTAAGGYLVRWETAVERNGAYGPTLGEIGGRVWIGLQKVNNAWTWDDGRVAGDEIEFRSGEPSGDGPCVEWGPSNSLNDIPCDEDRDYVCARDPAGTPGP